MRLLALLTILTLVPAVQAQRVEWDTPTELRVSGADKLKLDGVRVAEWRQNQPEALLALRVSPDGKDWRLLSSQPLDIKAQHALVLKNGKRLPVLPNGVLDAFVCTQPLGVSDDSLRVFRLFAPRATSVRLHVYSKPGDEQELLSREAVEGQDGSWSVVCPEALNGMAWTWSLSSATGVKDWTDPRLEFADPWATAVATRNHYTHPGRGLLLDESYAWKAVAWKPLPADSLIILETHLRDATAGPGAGAGALAGTYPGYWRSKPGGLAHLKSLGATAVEFLPLQEFGNYELDYKNPATPVFNDWNPYARNHWGYMTSAFLAPEAYYASGQDLTPGGWCGLDGRQVREFQELVDQCHLAGVAVLMDVVYNHVSQYDHNPLKMLDMGYWFRLNDDGTLASTSGCGNDLRTERPLARRLILDSVTHFAEAYRVDGYRFDLGAMIDDETLRQLHELFAARGLFHTAEPWGGGAYEPETFARLGWSWWNDQYRVDLRGRQPVEGQGFLFGSFHKESSPARIIAAVQGSAIAAGGINPDPRQAVNYIAAHDDHDLGDWIKLGLGLVREDTLVVDRLAFQRLTQDELLLHGVAALHLLSSGGVPMLHLGQDMGRSKLIARGCAQETRTGHIDHNSYEKDNATNWIDWRLLTLNKPLAELYRKAVVFRRAHPGLASAPRDVLEETLTGAHLAWTCEEAGVAAAFNTEAESTWVFRLPGTARVALSSGRVDLDSDGHTLRVGPRSAVLLDWQP
jgi:pullulanase/glycogen debranching enzyme